MTTSRSSARVSGGPAVFAFPDPPESEREDLTGFDHLTFTGSVRDLFLHFGEPANAIFLGDKYLAEKLRVHPAELRRPDLLIAFNANPELYRRSNAYVISEQGKPPDFILEVGSPSTRAEDAGQKREDYARLGVVEYWRFDPEDSDNVVKLADDRLVRGRYEPVPITGLDAGHLEGRSIALNLCLRWEQGQLRWYDPENQRYILTARDYAERANLAESRIRELEAQLRQHGVEPIQELTQS